MMFVNDVCGVSQRVLAPSVTLYSSYDSSQTLCPEKRFRKWQCFWLYNYNTRVISTRCYYNFIGHAWRRGEEAKGAEPSMTACLLTCAASAPLRGLTLPSRKNDVIVAHTLHVFGLLYT